MVTTGLREPFVNGFTASPHSIQIPYLRRQGPSTYEAILLDHPQQNTVLKRCGLPRGPRGPAWHQSSSDSMPPEDAVEGSTSQTHVTSSGTLPHAVKGKCKHSMPNTYTVGRGIIRLISENWEKICNCWFELVTVRRQLGGNDHLSCSFEFWRSHLALKWKSGQGKVRFRWGAVTGTFHVNFSALEAQKFDPYRFYCFIWGVNNIFFKSVQWTVAKPGSVLLLPRRLQSEAPGRGDGHDKDRAGKITFLRRNVISIPNNQATGHYLNQRKSHYLSQWWFNLLVCMHSADSSVKLSRQP